MARLTLDSGELELIEEPVQKSSFELKGDERYSANDVVDGKYRLLRRIGAGGYSRVWLAHNSVLDVQVALKIIYMDGLRRSSFIERALGEARAAAQIGHPAIVHVFDFGITRYEDPFVAMEFLSGETLASAIIERGRISATEAIQTLLPIADALAATHSVGIVHRDVKPENIFLCSGAHGRIRPKLLDFGIARRIHVERRITAEGAVVGTPDYMSPEQARGQAADERTDIWSLAIVLYELISGRMPFLGDNYNALIQAILEQEPPPITEFLGGDDALWGLMAKALQKNPNDRWPSMRCFAEALAEWLYERGVHEDICSVSLRGTWLSHSDSDAKIEVVSVRPGPESIPVTREAPAPVLRNRLLAVATAGALALLIGATSFGVPGKKSAALHSIHPAIPAARGAEPATLPATLPAVSPVVMAETANPNVEKPRREKPPKTAARAPSSSGALERAGSAKRAPDHDSPMERAKRIDFGF